MSRLFHTAWAVWIAGLGMRCMTRTDILIRNLSVRTRPLWHDCLEKQIDFGTSRPVPSLTPDRPRRMVLADPCLECQVEPASASSGRIRIKAAKPALWVRLELEGHRAVFSDNFFHLRPGHEELIGYEIQRDTPSDPDLLRIRASSLFHSY